MFAPKLTKIIPNPTKAKEYYELFLKTKIEKFPSNGGIKSVTIRDTKTTSNFLKPRIQSNIITQEVETVENPNVFDTESVTIEHWKTVTKLSKPTKQPKIITQQPNRIKVST